MPNRNKNIPMIRRGFGLKDSVAESLAGEYRSRLVQHLRDNHLSFDINEIRIILAKEFGFCYGVDPRCGLCL